MVGIEGIQEVQQANITLINSLQPGGALSNAVRGAITEFHRLALFYTHVNTGALRASHRIQYTGGLSAEMYIDPSAVNPYGERPAKYGLEEHSRGGTHAFYDLAFTSNVQKVAEVAGQYYMRALP